MALKAVPAFTLGQPQVTGGLALFPVFGGAPRCEYRGLAQAVKLGAVVKELGTDGSVNEVMVANTTDQPVLVYEGELIKGARQNRTIDLPVLVPASVDLRIPVSCVEQGRWDSSQHYQPMAPADSAMGPNLRAAKRADANGRGFAGMAPRPAQAAVWSAVGTLLSDHHVDSPSADLSRVYEHRRPELDDLRHELRPVDGQLGVVVEISGRPVALDLVSRAEVFADLLPRLTDGYALSALGADSGVPSTAAAEAFLQAALGGKRRWLQTPGMGEAFAPQGRDVDGCGLTVDGELVALSAFPATMSGAPAAA